MLIERWWSDLDVSTFVDFSVEEEPENERAVFSRTKVEIKSTQVAAVPPWGEAAMEDGEDVIVSYFCNFVDQLSYLKLVFLVLNERHIIISIFEKRCKDQYSLIFLCLSLYNFRPNWIVSTSLRMC